MFKFYAIIKICSTNLCLYLADDLLKDKLQDLIKDIIQER